MKFLFSFILIVSNTVMFAQLDTGIITYKVYSAYDDGSRDAEIDDFMKKTHVEMQKLEFELKFNSPESYFKLKDELEVGDNSYFKNMALAMAGASNRLWYTDSKYIIMQYNFMNELFLIQSHKNSIEWELSKDNKMIGEYLCYKANCTIKNIGSKGLGERAVEVWYSKDIPVQLGPLGLVGLPGLILEANFLKVSYVASSIKLSKGEKLEISRPQKGKIITESDFFDMATLKAKQFREDLKQ